jgi:hypothetical protein
MARTVPGETATNAVEVYAEPVSPETAGPVTGDRCAAVSPDLPQHRQGKAVLLGLYLWRTAQAGAAAGRPAGLRRLANCARW